MSSSLSSHWSIGDIYNITNLFSIFVVKNGGKPVVPNGPIESQLTSLLCAKLTDPRTVLRCLNYCVDRSKQNIGQVRVY